ncbi:hypothetical protein N5J43_26145 [Pseudomonas nicosulfuronedens]|uniref:DUF2147 domain-containing protein n=1 Tax=Pseudomonas nicosulfuronedens TaxID=2571105 RepID=A0A5R9R233_9PSED|nr:hypothetical protein [Pseudomonas nicosulfuronedens]MDH1012148.1 hypothetical protein [Pseudomonas nicosulfuronedens]MDH1982450.1 hypothetical protein [Pseudomonas nicosulfuronedens]MDH2030133.1 hypothetical protein [Pseudomonas nicosulfuronedens]TLX76698.1 hypothetical protein FAS41_14090 [Pseudomonas nicosulfuronedens]
MKRGFLVSSLCLALLTPSLSAWGMSRLFDGDANVWMQDRTLCFGGAAFKSPGLFFNRTLQVDERQVAVQYIEVSREPYEPFWSSASIEPTQGVPLRSDTCFAYGRAIAGFREKTPARLLEPGLYSVTVGGHDSAGDGQRATFMKTFCLEARGDGLAVIKAGYDEKAGRWRCEPAQ